MTAFIHQPDVVLYKERKKLLIKDRYDVEDEIRIIREELRARGFVTQEGKEWNEYVEGIVDADKSSRNK